MKFNHNQQAFYFSQDRRYLVILADRQQGKYFTIHLGIFEDKGEEIVIRDVPQKIKAEGFRAGKIGRHIAGHLQHHLKYIGQKALNFLIRKQIKKVEGVIVGGHREIINKIIENLPQRLKKIVISQFVSDINLPVGDLTEKAKRTLY